MINRFKFISAAFFGLALVSGGMTGASASPRRAAVSHTAAASKAGPVKTHRVVRLRHAAKVHLAHRAAVRHLAKAHAAPVARGKSAGAATGQHQAMAHRIGGRPSVIR